MAESRANSDGPDWGDSRKRQIRTGQCEVWTPDTRVLQTDGPKLQDVLERLSIVDDGRKR